MKWFTGKEKTAEELKQSYWTYVRQYHPDVNKAPEAEEIMKEINGEYHLLFDSLKNFHVSFDGNGVYEKETKETPQDFILIIDNLLKLNVDIELCGRWIWISGDTKRVKDELRELGCKWSPKKMMWSWHFPEDSKVWHRKNPFEMEEIRERYGSVNVFTADRSGSKSPVSGYALA